MFKHKFSLGRVAAIVVGMHLSMSAGAVTFTLSEFDTTAGTGDSVTLDLIVAGLTAGGPDSLGDYDIDIGFDASALALTDVEFGRFLGGPNASLQLASQFAPGGVNVTEISFLEADAASSVFTNGPFLDDIQPDTFVLASLGFDVIDLTPGARPQFTIDVNAAGDGFGKPLAVPEPRLLTSGAIWIAIGLMAFGALRKQPHAVRQARA